MICHTTSHWPNFALQLLPLLPSTSQCCPQPKKSKKVSANHVMIEIWHIHKLFFRVIFWPTILHFHASSHWPNFMLLLLSVTSQHCPWSEKSKRYTLKCIIHFWHWHTPLILQAWNRQWSPGIKPWTRKKITLQGQGFKPWPTKKIMLQGQGFEPWTYQKDRVYDHAHNCSYTCTYDHEN